MKKVFRMIMASLLVLPMVVACGNDDELLDDSAALQSQASRGSEETVVEESQDQTDAKLDSIIANGVIGVPGEYDRCGLSQTEFTLDNGEQVIEVTSEIPFSVLSVQTRRWAYDISDLDDWEKSINIEFFDNCERNEFKPNPDEYVKEGSVDFVRFERDSQKHIRVFLTANETEDLRDCFIVTYDPSHAMWEGYTIPHNYGRIWIKQEAE